MGSPVGVVVRSECRSRPNCPGSAGTELRRLGIVQIQDNLSLCVQQMVYLDGDRQTVKEKGENSPG